MIIKTVGYDVICCEDVTNFFSLPVVIFSPEVILARNVMIRKIRKLTFPEFKIFCSCPEMAASFVAGL